MEDADVPTREPDDAVMAQPAEVQAMDDWVRAAFLGQEPPVPGPRVKLTLRRQDFNVLRYGESCMETPIKIGGREFEHGLVLN